MLIYLSSQNPLCMYVWKCPEMLFTKCKHWLFLESGMGWFVVFFWWISVLLDFFFSTSILFFKCQLFWYMNKSNLHSKKLSCCGFKTQGNSGSPWWTRAKQPVPGAGLPKCKQDLWKLPQGISRLMEQRHAVRCYRWLSSSPTHFNKCSRMILLNLVVLSPREHPALSGDIFGCWN